MFQSGWQDKPILCPCALPKMSPGVHRIQQQIKNYRKITSSSPGAKNTQKIVLNFSMKKNIYLEFTRIRNFNVILVKFPFATFPGHLPLFLLSLLLVISSKVADNLNMVLLQTN